MQANVLGIQGLDDWPVSHSLVGYRKALQYRETIRDGGPDSVAPSEAAACNSLFHVLWRFGVSLHPPRLLGLGREWPSYTGWTR